MSWKRKQRRKNSFCVRTIFVLLVKHFFTFVLFDNEKSSYQNDWQGINLNNEFYLINKVAGAENRNFQINHHQVDWIIKILTYRSIYCKDAIFKWIISFDTILFVSCLASTDFSLRTEFCCCSWRTWNRQIEVPVNPCRIGVKYFMGGGVSWAMSFFWPSYW